MPWSLGRPVGVDMFANGTTTVGSRRAAAEAGSTDSANPARSASVVFLGSIRLRPPDTGLLHPAQCREPASVRVGAGVAQRGAHQFVHATSERPVGGADVQDHLVGQPELAEPVREVPPGGSRAVELEGGDPLDPRANGREVDRARASGAGSSMRYTPGLVLRTWAPHRTGPSAINPTDRRRSTAPAVRRTSATLPPRSCRAADPSMDCSPYATAAWLSCGAEGRPTTGAPGRRAERRSIGANAVKRRTPCPGITSPASGPGTAIMVDPGRAQRGPPVARGRRTLVGDRAAEACPPIGTPPTDRGARAGGAAARNSRGRPTNPSSAGCRSSS